MKKKYMVIITIIFGLLAIIVALPFYAFMHPACDVKNINQFTSTDGQYTANLLVKNCGATSDYITHVELKNNNTNDQAQVLAIRGDLGDVTDKNQRYDKIHFTYEIVNRVVDNSI